MLYSNVLWALNEEYLRRLQESINPYDNPIRLIKSDLISFVLKLQMTNEIQFFNLISI